MGAGERALFVTEEFGLEKPLRDRRAVHLDEGSEAAGRCGVNSASDKVFADAALAANEYRRVGVGDALDDGPDFLHPGMSIEEREMIDGVAIIRLSQRLVR